VRPADVQTADQRGHRTCPPLRASSA
jgi:hypothetical protein